MKSKTPHYVMMVCSTLAVLVATILALQGKGQIALPVSAVAILTLVNNVLGSLSGAMRDAATTSSTPKPPSVPPAAMLSVLVLACAAKAAMIVVIACVLLDCGAGGPTTLQQEQVTAYGASQIQCIETAKLAGKTEADAVGCRNAMRKYWCGDGGALSGVGGCTYTPIILDAGADK